MTTAARIVDRAERVSLGTKTNYPGMGTLLPYALLGTPNLEVATPIRWERVSSSVNGSVTAGNFENYRRRHGDVFGALTDEIGAQDLGTRDERRAPILRVAVALSARSLPRKALSSRLPCTCFPTERRATPKAFALSRGLLPASTTRKYVYTALHEYVERTLGAGRIPRLIQLTGTSSFRINEPADLWPDIALPSLPRWLDDAAREVLVQRLRDTSQALDTESFEIAVCDAFSALGFVSTHIGGNGAPDGVLAAPLGLDGYLYPRVQDGKRWLRRR